MTSQNIAVPFDQYGRYQDLRGIIDIALNDTGDQKKDMKILDVGGFFQPIKGDPYLPIVNFFSDFSPLVVDRTVPTTKLPHYIMADGIFLPFPDRSFDWVNAADVIEHIPAEQRSLFIGELLRCSKNHVSLSTPINTPAVNLAEEFVVAYLQRVLNIEHQALKEHRQYGLLSEKAMEKLVREQSSSLSLEIIPSGNLFRWIFLMISRHLFISFAPNEGFNPQIDGLYNMFGYGTDHSLPAYRNIYIISKQRPEIPVQKRFFEKLECSPEKNNFSEPLLLDLLSRIEDQERWKMLQKLVEQDQERWQHLNQAHQRIEDLIKEKEEAQAQAQYFHRELQALSQIWPVKMWRRLKSFRG